ncbi:YdaS family helix-turn-helix protein [Acinetobacter sp. HY1485]|uniref:YdaS family helix-turn-helix protein n=1 Tax=Acinetobacter sp. HY1485 TaxID=2970918 RepID=UPI0022B98169|nr:YdaS family helix-turn-helix protein [Acinetobacter sp. HY1485]
MAKHEKKHVKSLLAYLKQSQDVESLAQRIGTTQKNLLQIGYGGSVSARLAIKICEATNHVVSKKELRPDIFA